MGRLAGLLGILALLAGISWLALRTPAGGADAAVPGAVAPVEAARATRTKLAVPAGGAPRVEPESPPLAGAGPVAARDTEAHPLLLRFFRGDGTPLRPAASTVVLTRECDDERVVFSAEGADHVSGTIGLGSWRVEVSAPGYSHRPVVHEFSSSRRGFDERLYLWPEDWLPVVVRTADGRPFEELARDRELDPRRYFSHAFGVETSSDDSFTTTGSDDVGGPLAVFHTPHTTWSYALLEAVAGSLEVLRPRPFWARLTIHGAPQAGQFVGAADTEVVFEIDLDAVRDSFASLSLRLVDRDSGQPVAAAVGTLKADNSSHRRGNLQDVSTDEHGRLRFDDVIPGAHDLLLTRGGNFVQRKLELATGQHLELGEVEIGGGPGLLVRVVDTQGQPAPAVIEVTPYARGGSTGNLYHPNLHRVTDGEGKYTLPLPDVVSIVRARPLYLRGSQRDYQTVGTRNLLLDPEYPPPELVLVAQLPEEVRFETAQPWGAGHALTVEDDELGLTIARTERVSKVLDLVPGRYVIRHWDGDLEVGTVDIVVGSQPQTVQVP